MSDPADAKKEVDAGRIGEGVLEAMPAPVCVVDGEGLILYANSALATLCGGTRGDLPGKPAGLVLGVLPSGVRDSLFEALREKKRIKVAVTWDGEGKEPVLLDGEAFFFSLPGPGSLPAAAWTARVLPSSVPEAEVAAMAASRKKARELLSVVRHDILNQLTILIGFLQYSEDFVEDPQLREFLSKEEAAGQAIQALIEFTRDFQDMLVEDPRWIPVLPMIKSAMIMTDAGNVSIEPGVSTVEVFGSPLMKHVFVTLIKNALDHATGLTRITLTDERDGSDLLLVCEDDGPGIPAAERKALFDRGHGRNRGYSLWLSREILAITGGTLEENGREGSGARFEIRVPAGMWRCQKENQSP